MTYTITFVTKLFIPLMSFLFFSSSAEESGPLVSLPLGKIRGTFMTSFKGRTIEGFLKVPYALPPVGENRFKTPIPVTKWNSELNATQIMPWCAQLNFIEFISKSNPRFVGQEDCLYTNVYTPKSSPKEPLPVMVYFHGGGFVGGGAEYYEPQFLLDQDIVLVVVQYRLGILGFLTTGDSVIPGNFGLMDQTAALRWVQNYISYFGGNPTEVTIFGESAGGASVDYHLFSPHSQNLFSRAILQSGTALCPWASSGTAQTEAAKNLAGRFKCNTDDEGDESENILKCLQEVPVQELVTSISNYYKINIFPNVFSPRVDGDFVPDWPEVLLREGRHAKVDMIIGVNEHEGAYVTGPLYSYDEQINSLRSNFDEMGPVLLDLRTEEKDRLSVTREAFQFYMDEIGFEEEHAEQLNKMLSDRHFTYCSDMSAFHYVKNSHESYKVFLYELQHKGSKSLMDVFSVNIGSNWVSHADELCYLFPMKVFGPHPPTQTDEKLISSFCNLWTNFARKSDPTPDLSLGFRWNALSADDPQFLAITLEPQMKPYYRTKERDFWASLNTNQNNRLGLNKISYNKDEL